MAKYTVTYACGHTVEMQLCGKTADREKKIAWYKTMDCPECKAKAAAEAAAEAGLPFLKGSEKQVGWASEIREKTLRVLEQAMPMFKEDMRETFLGLRSQWLEKEVAASYWIDNRNFFNEARYIVSAILKSTNYQPTK